MPDLQKTLQKVRSVRSLLRDADGYLDEALDDAEDTARLEELLNDAEAAIEQAYDTIRSVDIE